MGRRTAILALAIAAAAVWCHLSLRAEVDRLTARVALDRALLERLQSRGCGCSLFTEVR